MGSPGDAIKLVDEIRELFSDATRRVVGFLEDFRAFKTSMPERLYHALEECPDTKDAKDADAAVKCVEDLAEELRYLIERLDAMTEELNTAYNALRKFLDIYYSINRRH
jgi:hypothetical protein